MNTRHTISRRRLLTLLGSGAVATVGAAVPAHAMIAEARDVLRDEL